MVEGLRLKLKVFTSIILGITLTSAFSQSGGTLKLNAQNPHYFQYRNKPLILIGSGEHYGSVVNLDFDYKKYLTAIAADGLNTTRLFTGAYIEKLGDFGIQRNTLAPSSGKLLLPWRRSNEDGFALGGNKFDLSQWDDAYFERLKDFMIEAASKNVIVEVNLFSAHYAAGWNYSAFNPKNNINKTDSVQSKMVNTLENGNILKYQENYLRKIVRELNGLENFYFEIQNEPWADQTEIVLPHNEYGPEKDWRSTLQVVSQRSRAWQSKVASWIKDEESKLSNKHLVAQNISNFHYPVTQPDPNISIFNFHYTYPVAVTENYHLNRVIGFNETGFAGRANATYRRQAWRFIMAGGALFNHLDYSFSVGFENGQDTTYTAPGGGSPLLRRSLGVLKNFFEKFNIVELKPDHEFILAAPGAEVETLKGVGQWIIYFEPMSSKPDPIILNLVSGTYRAEWFDVATGRSILTTPIIKRKLEVPEGMNDKVVIVTQTGRN